MAGGAVQTTSAVQASQPTSGAASQAGTPASTAGAGGQPTSSAVGGQSSSGNMKLVDHLTMDGYKGAPAQQRNFNPYSPNHLTATTSFIYEPMYVVNSYNGDLNPWLATSYKWQDNKTLVFKIRQGVKWNDGKPFSSDDVVFTFNLMKKNAAIDTNGLWRYLASVTADGDQVTFKYKKPAVPTFLQVATTVMMAKQGKLPPPARLQNRT